MRDEKEERKKQARSNKQNKAKQHRTPKAVTFPKKNELPRVGLELTTLYRECFKRGERKTVINMFFPLPKIGLGTRLSESMLL